MKDRFKFSLTVNPYTPKEDRELMLMSSAPIVRKTRCEITLHADVDSATGNYIAGFLNSALAMAEAERAKMKAQ